MTPFSLGPNTILLPNPPADSRSLHRCSISARPIFGIPLNSTVVRKSCIFDARTVRPGLPKALATGSGSVEKGMQFSPTFDDYVKVMEAVRTERGKSSVSDVDGKRTLGKDAHRGRRGKKSEDRRVRKSKELDDVESSASGWGLVGGILEKARAGRSRDANDGGFGDGESNSYRKFDGGEGIVGGVHFKRKDVKIGKYSKNRKDLIPNGRNGFRERKFGSDVNSEELNKGRMERRGRLVSDHDNSLTRDRYTYRRNMENGSYGMSGDNVKVISDSHRRVQKFGYDDDSEVFRKRRVEQSGNWARGGTESLTRDTNSREMERMVHDDESSRSFRGREKSEEGRYYGARSSKESTGSKISENKCKNDIRLTVDQRRTDGQFRRSGMGIIEMDSEQNKYDDEMKENRAESGIYKSKRDFSVSGNEFVKLGVNQTRLRFQGDAMETAACSSGSFEMRGRSSTNVSRADEFGGRDIDDEDRAAFRTFEVFTDVRNRPRILRMEMEERIEKLAKWLNAKDVNMPEWQFSKMMHSANIKFTDHTILRVVQILGALGNWRRVLQVVEWLHSRERFTSYKSRYIYTTVLDVLGKARRPTEALNIFYAMRQDLSSYPDLAAYHCIAVILGQAGLIKELFDVIDCMRATPEKKFKLGPLQKWDPRREPDLVIYNAVLNACVHQKQWEGAFWVFQQLKQCNIKPTNTTYGLAMEVMLACEKYNLVHEFFRKVNKTSVPSALNYKVLIKTLWKEGKIDEAVQAVQDMERRGIVGSASLYYDLARCLCSAGRCQEALLQVDKICKVARKPLVVTYTGLIQACLDSGNIDDGVYIFNQMLKFCSPNTVTCNIMLKSYLEHGMFEEAKELFHKILDGSHDFDGKSSLRHKVIPDKFMFNTMMEACAATNNWDDFEHVYGQMLNHGFHFDAKRHLRMVLDAFRAGKVQIMETTWDYLVRSGRVPPPPIIKERFCSKLKEDDPMAAVSCIGIHQEIAIEAFSEKAWLNLISGSADRLRKNTIIRLASEVGDLVEQSDRPHPIFQNLLKACQKFLSLNGNLVDGTEDSKALTMIYS